MWSEAKVAHWIESRFCSFWSKGLIWKMGFDCGVDLYIQGAAGERYSFGLN